MLDSPKAQQFQQIGAPNDSGSSTGSSNPPFPPDLASVVAAWGTLTDPIKLAVLALVRSAGGSAGAR
jgi:hypothetical protein